MWPLGVELIPESIEAGLLLKTVHTGWASSLLFQGEMHALMPAILLRLPGFDALDVDAQAQPPDGQLGQIEQGIGAGERYAVVGADGSG